MLKGVYGNYQLTGRNLNLFGSAKMSSATMPISNIAKWGKRFGVGSFGFGFTIDMIGVYNYTQNPNSPNAVHPAKAAVNTVIGLWDMGISKIGLRANPIVAIVYSGVDAFYPGGWLGDKKARGIKSSR
jgi:hypothetical protein